MKKHFKKYSNESAFDLGKSILTLPYVVYINDTGEVKYQKVINE